MCADILDGLEDWATDLVYLTEGGIKVRPYWYLECPYWYLEGSLSLVYRTRSHLSLTLIYTDGPRVLHGRWHQGTRVFFLGGG